MAFVPITQDQASGGHSFQRIGDLRCACDDCGMVLVVALRMDRGPDIQLIIDTPFIGDDPVRIEYRYDQHRCGKPVSFDEMVSQVQWLGEPTHVDVGRAEWLYKLDSFEPKYHIILQEVDDRLEISTDLPIPDDMYQPEPWVVCGVSVDKDHPLMALDSALQKASFRIQDQIHTDYPIEQRMAQERIERNLRRRGIVK